MTNVQWLSMLLSAALIVLLLHLIRRKQLREQYALLWLLFGFIILILSVNTAWLEWMAKQLGVVYAPSLLFLVGITLCILLILHLTVVVSKLADRVIRLTQELGLAKTELEKRANREGR